MSRARDLQPSAYQNFCSAGSPGFYQSLPYDAAGIGPRIGTSERIRCIDPGKRLISGVPVAPVSCGKTRRSVSDRCAPRILAWPLRSIRPTSATAVRKRSTSPTHLSFGQGRSIVPRWSKMVGQNRAVPDVPEPIV